MHDNNYNKADEQKTASQRDISDLMTNGPWMILLIIGIMFSLFTVIRPSAASYYMNYVLGRQDLIDFYFAVTLGGALVGALATNFLFGVLSKKTIITGAFLLGGLSSMAIYLTPADNLTMIIALNVLAEFFGGALPVVFMSMLADTVDYSEWRNNRRATGLIFSAGTFINKTGVGFAGAIAMLTLAFYGYDVADPAAIEASKPAMTHLMSGIPALFAFIGAGVMMLYPLNDEKMDNIAQDLSRRHQ